MANANRMGSAIGATMVVNGRTVDYFCGTSYYALHGNPQVIDAACAAAKAYGIGPGTIAEVPVYEETIALARRFMDAETVSYMVSGYLGMMVLLQALSDDFDLALVDAASHYSVFDALKTVQKPVVAFRHRDPESLAAKLAAHTGAGKVPAIVTDGVFPSTGALAPLPDYAEIMSRYPSAILCVDDSHALGVIGANGRGTLEHFGLEGPNRYLAGTLSKAFGGAGGIVPGPVALAEKIERNVRLMRGASLPPIPAAAAGGMGLRILSEQPQMRTALGRNVRRVRNGLGGLGYTVEDSPVPIVSVTGPTDLEQVRLALDSEDIAIRRVAPRGYSDAPEVETLRIAVFSTHTDAQIDRLIGRIAEL